MPPELHFALVGDPVEHSLSPLIQRTALALAGLRGDYRAFRGGVDELERLMRGLVEGELDGLNVTMPLKRHAFDRCRTHTGEAVESGSVSTLRLRDGRPEGHSTDVVSFREIYSSLGSEGQLLVLGSGGSARAAVAAWPGDRAHVSARRASAVARLAIGGRQVISVPWGEGLPGAVLVNATPLGMEGESLPDGPLRSASVLIDMPYGAGTTPAVDWMSAAGRPAVDGIEFLARQAAAAFEWWTGVHVDSTRLESAARNA